MDLSYCECTVKRADRRYKIIKYMWVMVTVYLFFFNCFVIPLQNLTFTLVVLLDVVALFFAWPNFSAEYEYVFCDGQIDFDIIKSGRKRKTLKKIDLIDADLVCGIDDERMLKYKEFIWKKNYVSGRNYKNAYYIVLRKGNGQYARVMFEPNEKMFECIKNRYPRITFKNENVSDVEN